MANIINCKEISTNIRKELAERASQFWVQPGLAVILVGDDPASEVYVRNKQRACEEVGFYSVVHRMPSTSTTDEVIKAVTGYAQRSDIHGILVQLPLPKQIDADKVIEAIPPKKDVDGLTPVNMGKLMLGNPMFTPCTPTGVMTILRKSFGSISGANCVIIGRSNIVGKPLAAMMTQANATVTLCHSKTCDLGKITQKADILVSSVGKAGFVTADMVHYNAVVIDVGINRNAEGKLVGDVCFDGVADKVGAITPVPGGVGVMTVTSLLENTFKAAELLSKKTGDSY